MSDLMGGFMHAIETINGGASSSHEAQPAAGIGRAAEAYQTGFQDGRNHQIGVCYPAPYDFDYERGYRDGNAALEQSQNGIEVDDGTGLTLAQALEKEYEMDPRLPIDKDKDPKYKSLQKGFPNKPSGPWVKPGAPPPMPGVNPAPYLGPFPVFQGLFD
jgi:hypothetical protein